MFEEIAFDIQNNHWVVVKRNKKRQYRRFIIKPTSRIFTKISHLGWYPDRMENGLMIYYKAL